MPGVVKIKRSLGNWNLLVISLIQSVLRTWEGCSASSLCFYITSLIPSIILDSPSLQLGCWDGCRIALLFSDVVATQVGFKQLRKPNTYQYDLLNSMKFISSGYYATSWIMVRDQKYTHPHHSNCMCYLGAVISLLFSVLFWANGLLSWFFWRRPCIWNWSTINISLNFRILSGNILPQSEVLIQNSRKLITTGCLWLSKMINPVKHNALPEKQQMYFNNPNTLFWWFAPSIQQKSVNVIVQCNEPGIFSSIVHCSWTGLSVVTCAE